MKTGKIILTITALLLAASSFAGEFSLSMISARDIASSGVAIPLPAPAPELSVMDGAEAACHVARKILAACDAAFELAGNPVRVGVSGGIALFPQHGSTFDELSRHADGAMYAAKRGGRMRCMLYRGPDAEPEAVLPVPVLAATAR